MTMTMDEIMEQIIVLAENDQSIDDVAMTSWVAQGINRINVALNSNFPSSLEGTASPAFDPRYHEALVLFGVAKYRESDSDYNAATYLLNQFDTMLLTMQRDMVVPPSYKLDYNYQQIVVTDATTFVYNLDIPYGSYFDEIKVYVNDRILNSSQYRINQSAKIITFIGVTLTVDDKLTIQYENNSDLNAPPYGWWTF